MSTIDDAAVTALIAEAREKGRDRNYDCQPTMRQLIMSLAFVAENQQREIARLQDQLATARKGLERLWPKWTAQAGAPIAQWVCAEEIRELLAAIPLASDCELLLEEARVLIEILNRSATPSEYWRIKIADFFTKFPK